MLPGGLEVLLREVLPVRPEVVPRRLAVLPLDPARARLGDLEACRALEGLAAGLAPAALAAARVADGDLAAVFAAGLAADFCAVGFVAGFLAAVFLAAGFLAAGFLAAGFFAAGLRAAGFRAAGFRLADRGAGATVLAAAVVTLEVTVVAASRSVFSTRASARLSFC